MGEARRPARDAVVRPLSRAAGRPCARPGCPSPARATLGFRYHSREAWLAPLSDETIPAAYDLCATHADKTRPPHGWALVDERPDEDEPTPGAAVSAAEFGGEQTVAVLAAALRSVPDTAAPRRLSDVADDVPASDDEVDLREALAELQSVLVSEAEAVEPIALDHSLETLVEQQEELAVLTEAVHELERQVDSPAPVDDRPRAEPRPVPAASRRDRDGAARHW